MSRVTLSVGSDYELTGVVTNFEAYMFITTPKFIAEHPIMVPGELVIVDGNRGHIIKPLAVLDDRKASLTKFNQLAKAKIPSMPAAKGLSCVLIDFMPVDEHGPGCTAAEYATAYQELKRAFLKYMKDNDRVAVMVQHWRQGRRYPHVHILYQRTLGKHDEFQTWLCDGGYDEAQG